MKNYLPGLLGGLLLLCAGAFLFPARAQYVQWTANNLLNDLVQEGMYPAGVTDAAGNLHISYWNREADRLVYGMLSPNGRTVSWEIPEPDVAGGLRSAIALDQYGRPHIAYLANVGNEQRIRYVRLSLALQWEAAVVTTTSIGRYTPLAGQTDFYFQPSVDILVDENDNPTIAYFNAPNLAHCSDYTASPYLEMWRAFLVDGAWVNWRNAEYLWNGGGGKLPDQCYCYAGVRYGESVQLLRHPAHTHNIAVATAMCEGQIWELRETDPGNIYFPWNPVVLDSCWRAGMGGASTGPARHETTLEGISARFSPNGTLHVVYGSSQNHGFNTSTTSGGVPNFFNALVYLRRTPANSYTYVTLKPDDTTPEYRNSTSMALKGEDSLYIVYAERHTGEYRLRFSFNGGTTFSTEESVLPLPGARMKAPLAIQGDSLSILVGHTPSQTLWLGRRHISMAGAWRWSALTVSQKRGQELAVLAEPVAGDTLIHIAFEDHLQKKLWYGVRQGGNWSYTQLAGGDTYGQLHIHRLANDSLYITHVRGADQSIWITFGKDENWQSRVLFNSQAVGALSVVHQPGTDNLHYAYQNETAGKAYYRIRSPLGQPPLEAVTPFATDYLGEYLSLQFNAAFSPRMSFWDRTNGRLIYARRLGSNNWEAQVAVDLPASIVGTFTSLAFDGAGTPHIAYRNETDNQLELAVRPAGTWEREVVITSPDVPVGEPSQLRIDAHGKQWLLYNAAGLDDYLLLLYRDSSNGQWQPLAMPLPESRPGRYFAFQAPDSNQLYVAMRKQAPTQTGVLFLHGRFFPLDTTVPPDPSSRTAATHALQAQLWPNPVAHELNLLCALPVAASLRMELLDLQGRVVAVRHTPVLKAGLQQLRWELPQLSAGAYWCRLQAGEHSSTLRIQKY
ncbi:MAG: hypothetical protein KF690_08630 [Bacteroidetes bacterium]|nr:hypothetical protein [Bacteroidota bacterium]